MNLSDTQNLALDFMKLHNLDREWRFEFNNAKRLFGVCNHSKKTIELSRNLTLLNDAGRVKNTILHEIAHALCDPREWHGRQWRETAISIGCDGLRLYDSNEVMQPAWTWRGLCPNGHETLRHRRARVSCRRCRIAAGFNRRGYHKQFKIKWARI